MKEINKNGAVEKEICKRRKSKDGMKEKKE
jgi:hypothetical protein